MNLEELKEGLAQRGLKPIEEPIRTWLFENVPGENADIILKWIDALKGGEYKQGKQYLNKDNSYCCLGLLCEVAGVEKRLFPGGVTCYDVETYRLLFPGGVTCYDDETYRLPSSLATRLNINRSGELPNIFISLIALNDAWDFTFNEIANVIESYPHLLFNN